MCFQACFEYSNGNSFDIANKDEKIYIDTDGTPYLYYDGEISRYG